MKGIWTTIIMWSTVGLSAHAFSAEFIIEEIIVTATKREASVHDVPIAVSAYSGEDLKSRGVQDLKDLQQISPSLSVYDSNSSSNGGTLRIRGVGTTGNNAGLEAAVGTFVDGIYRPRSGQVFTDLVDIDRIEILRGPQGTLFGKNTSAGALHIITMKPEYEFGGHASVTGGNLDTRRAEVSVTGPLIEDVLAYRLSGTYSARDGYYEDIDTSDEFAEQDRWTVKGQLLFNPTNNLEARLIVDYSERDESCCPATFETLGPTAGIIRALGGDPQTSSGSDDVTVGTNFDPFEEIEDKGFSLEVTWDIVPSITLTSITGYREFEADRGQDVDFTNADIYLLGNGHEEFDNFSQEVRLQGTSGDIDWLVGVYGYTEDIENSGRFLELSSQGPAFFDALFAALGATPPGFILGAGLLDVGDGLAGEFDQDTEGWSIFTHNTWHATDRLDFTVGLRYSEEDKDGDSVINGTGGPNQVAENWPCATLPVATFCGNAGFDSSTDEEEWTGTVNVAFQISDDINSYVSYSRGYKAGGINLDPTANKFDPVSLVFTDSSTFDPEFVNAWEIGVKANFLDGTLTLNTALFYSDYSGFQLNTFNGAFFTIDNVNEVISQGIETEVIWNIANGVFVTGGVTYADSRYGSDAGFIKIGSSPTGVTVLDDQRITHSPYWQGSAALLVDRPLPGTPLSYIVNVNYGFRGDHNTGSDLDPEKRQGGYGIWNGQVGLRTADGGYEALLWGTNLGDKRYDTIIFDSVSQTGSFSSFVGAPQTYGLTLRANF